MSAMRLWHNKAECVLTFLVPIVFFSIFAWIFGSRGSGATPQLSIVVCDEVESEISKATIDAMAKTQSLRFYSGTHSIRKGATKPSDREIAASLVRRGMVSAAIVFMPAQTAQTSVSNNIPKQLGSIDVMTDSFDQVAGQVIRALVQTSMITVQVQQASSRLPNMQTSTQAQILPAIAIEKMGNAHPISNELNDRPLTPTIAMVDIMGAEKKNPIVAMYAAGIAVMFLLFSATTASGSLLDERENSTLERLLCSRMTMDQLLMGKWCYLVIVGVLQTTLMFVVGAAFFGLNLIDHLDGFMVMTIVTSSAAASFALMLAAICRSRTQLGWVSTILILSMSAIGGSMVPRYLMSENIQRVGQFTFNAWALDGYNKVFWRELPIAELQNELAVLVAFAFVFIVIARLFASRWDRA